MKIEINVWRKFIKLAILLCVPTIIAIQANAQCAYPPSSLKSSLDESFPGWKIVALKDLRKDDRELWVKWHASDCPGFVVGHFEPGNNQNFAITLFKESGGSLQQMLLVANLSGWKYRISTLNSPQKVAYLSVIYKMRPGGYRDVDGKILNINHDSILYEAIEAGAILYYFRNGKYESFILGD